MNRKNTFLYTVLLALLFVVNDRTSAREVIDSVYYYMKIDTLGVDMGYLRVDSVNTDSLVADGAKGDYALWRFKEFPAPSPADHYWIVNYKTGDSLRFKAPVSFYDTTAVIDNTGNLYRWEQLFLDPVSKVDTLIASWLDLSFVPQSYYLAMDKEGAVRVVDKDSLLQKYSDIYRPVRFRIERATRPPDESKHYRLNIDTLGAPATHPLGYLALDSVANTDSLRIDSVRSLYSAWRFATDTIVDDTTYYRIYNRQNDRLLAFNIPEDDTVAVLSGSGALNSWLIPFYPEDGGIGKFRVRDTVTRQTYYLGLKDSVVMLVSDTSEIKFLTFALEDEFPPVYVPPVVYPFDSTQVYKVKMLSGSDSGKYLAKNPLNPKPTNAITTYQERYIDSVYAHIPDGQFVVNRLNLHSLINRNAVAAVTDTFQYYIKAPGDTLPDIYIYKGDTVEAKPIDYGSLDKTDSLLGYKYFPLSDLGTDSCFYLVYHSTDSLNGRILGHKDRDVLLHAAGDTTRFFIEYARTDSSTEAPAGIASLRRNIYRLRSQTDTTRYVSSNRPSDMADNENAIALFVFRKEGEAPDRDAYPLVVEISDFFSYKFEIDSVDKRLRWNPVTNDSVSHLFRFVKTEIPVYPDDEFEYLRELPEGRGLYEIRSKFGYEDKMLTRNYYGYATFSSEGESVLRAGSYVPSDFHLWLDTARGPGSNRFRSSFYIVKDATDTIADVQGYFFHVNDSTNLTSADEYVAIEGKKYSRANFVRAKRTAPHRLELLDARLSIGEGTPYPSVINEYRFYLQKTETEAKYHIVTEKGYGGHGLPDSTGYLSYSFESGKYYFGPREGTAKLFVEIKKIDDDTSNEIVLPPSPEGETGPKAVAVTGGKGEIAVLNAAGNRIQVYNIVGQIIADKQVTTDNETIPVSRGIAIVKIGPSVTKKVMVK
jgi:hypothetical protein